MVAKVCPERTIASLVSPGFAEQMAVFSVVSVILSGCPVAPFVDDI